jgi:hypothetical protein
MLGDASTAGASYAYIQLLQLPFLQCMHITALMTVTAFRVSQVPG